VTAGPTTGPFGLSEGQIERYARHLILPELGGRGQRLLLDAQVALLGEGAAAEEAALFLAAAGVGRLTLDGRLVTTLGARLRVLNPDTAVAESDPAESDAIEVGGASRLHGAMIALQTICRLVGVGPEGAWTGTALLPDVGPRGTGGADE